MERLQIAADLLSPNAKLPEKAHPSDACWDLFCSKETRVSSSGGRAWVSCGLRIKLPKGYFARIYGRSGYSYENNCMIGAGVIDQDFIGEWKVLVFNFSAYPLTIPTGTKFAQFSLHRNIEAEVILSKDIPSTERGDKGFGSTDKK